VFTGAAGALADNRRKQEACQVKLSRAEIRWQIGSRPENAAESECGFAVVRARFAGELCAVAPGYIDAVFYLVPLGT
jgi:hypothetical protein